MKLPHYDFNLRLSWPPPMWLTVAALIGVVMSWFPLVMIAWARMDYSQQPRIHFFQDMDTQPRYGAQDASPVFADGRAMRPHIPGTVAWAKGLSRPGGEQGFTRTADPSMLRLDDHYWRGFRETHAGGAHAAAARPADTRPATAPGTRPAAGAAGFTYYDGFPQRLTIDAELLDLGRQHFHTYCAPCHGTLGYGDGPIHTTAAAHANNPRVNTVWVQPANLHETDTSTGKPKFGPGVYEDGRLFHVITYGKGNMLGYEKQVPDPHDRWAITAYVRALQASQRATADAVPADRRDGLAVDGGRLRKAWEAQQEEREQEG